MAVNGIIINQNSKSDYSNEAKAQFNFNKFNTNIFLDNMDRINNGQKLVTEELRDKLRRTAEDREDGINYSLYVKEDESNQNTNENRTKNFQHHNAVIRNPGASMMVAPGRTSSPAECETCANRKYQDGSDETDVSFQTPTHISPSIAATVILGHEHEHVANAYEKERMSSVDHNHMHAHVDQASVKLKVDICPECGRVYFSGGVTNTVISYTDDEQYKKQNYKHKIFVPSAYKDNIPNIEDLEKLLKSTGSEVDYFDDPNYDKENPYIIVPTTLKDRLGKEAYIEFLEEVTNLKIKPYDSPADEEENNKYKPYKIFDERNNNFSGSNIDMKS